MKKKPTKSKKPVQKKAAARRSARNAKAPAKKSAGTTRSPAKKPAKRAQRSGKKAAPSKRAVAKKTIKTAKAPARKTVKTAKTPAKKSGKAAQTPAKKTAGSSRRATKKTSGSTRAATKKATRVSKAATKKAVKAAKPKVKRTTETAKPTSRKVTRSPRTATKKKTASAKKSAKRTRTASPAVKQSVRKSKSKVKKTRKSTRSPKSVPAKRKSAAKPVEKALVKFDPLQRYLTEISNYKLLTREEERELGIRVREKGDKDAAYRLVTSNLRLVVKIALEFQRVWMQNLLDLIQEGNIGLMQAVKKFDPYKNVKFSYYASFWIKAYILKFIMDNWRLVKIGTTQGQRKLFFKLKKEKQKLIDEGFEPKPKLLSERLGVSEREIIDMDQRLDGWDVSLDAPLKEDSDTERIEFVSTNTESIEEKVSMKEIEVLLHNKIAEFRKNMSPRELEIFDLRIFSDNPVTLQEIGDRYGISRERVRQVEKNIIKKMREFFKREIPDFASYTEGSRAD